MMMATNLMLCASVNSVHQTHENIATIKTGTQKFMCYKICVSGTVFLSLVFALSLTHYSLVASIRHITQYMCILKDLYIWYVSTYMESISWTVMLLRNSQSGSFLSIVRNQILSFALAGLKLGKKQTALEIHDKSELKLYATETVLTLLFVV